MSDAPTRTSRGAAPVGPRTLRAWRRTGLVLGWSAVSCAVAALVTRLVGGPGSNAAMGVLLLVAFVGALVALGYLRRAWSDPVVGGEPAVVRARVASDVARTAWAVGLVASLATRALRDGDSTPTWLAVVGAVLGAVAIAAFTWMLVLATRWRPAEAQL